MSKAKTLRQSKEARRRALIYVKAWIPTMTVVLLLIAMFIPSLRYTVAGSPTKEVISESELLSNTWTTARQALFGGGEWQKTELGFAKASFYTMLLSIALFVISAAMSLWGSIGATRYYLNPKREGREHAVYRTFFSRPLIVGYQLLMLPLLAFPRMMVWFYSELLFYPTLLNLTFPEPLMIGIALLILEIVLTLTVKKWEMGMKLDVFEDPRRSQENEEIDEMDAEREAPHFETEAEQKNYEMNEKMREEQLEKIRKLLSRDDEQDKEDKGNT